MRRTIWKNTRVRLIENGLDVVNCTLQQLRHHAALDGLDVFVIERGALGPVRYTLRLEFREITPQKKARD